MKTVVWVESEFASGTVEARKVVSDPIDIGHVRMTHVYVGGMNRSLTYNNATMARRAAYRTMAAIIGVVSPVGVGNDLSTIEATGILNMDSRYLDELDLPMPRHTAVHFAVDLDRGSRRLFSVFCDDVDLVNEISRGIGQ